MKKIYLLIVGIISLFTFNIKQVNADTIVVLNHNNINIGINSNATLRATDEKNNVLNNIIWRSDDPNIATVSNGIIIGKSIGTTRISAHIGSSKATCTVNVIENFVPITEIVTDKTKEELLINETKKISVTIKPSNASNKTLTYYSSKPNIVTVDNSGNITGKSEGSSYITISSPGYTIRYLVTVIDKIPLKSISIKSTLELEEKSTEKLSVTFSPSNATNKKVTWKSDNPEVATVDSNGKITAISPGKAKITVISNEGGFAKTCVVTVKEISKEVKNIKLNKTSLALKIGQEEKLTVSFDPTYAENKDVSWTTANKEVAIVEDGNVTAIGIGTTEIKVVSDDGQKEAICKITVTSNPIESIKFEQEEYTVFLGSETKLNTISTPQNTVITNPIWKSSDEEIATVENGVLLAKAIGEVTVTVSNKDGKIKAETLIKIIEKPSEPLMITIDGYDLKFTPEIKNYTLKIGSETKLNINTNIEENKVTINGNNELKNGSIITITIDGDSKETYVINIKKSEFPIIYFIIIISILLLINLIRIIMKNKKNKK